MAWLGKCDLCGENLLQADASLVSPADMRIIAGNGYGDRLKVWPDLELDQRRTKLYQLAIFNDNDWAVCRKCFIETRAFAVDLGEGLSHEEFRKLALKLPGHAPEEMSRTQRAILMRQGMMDDIERMGLDPQTKRKMKDEISRQLEERYPSLRFHRDRPSDHTTAAAASRSATVPSAEARRYDEVPGYPSNPPSHGARWLLVLVAVVALGAGVWVWQQASTTWSMGTLIVTVETEYVRAPFYWVYAKQEGKAARIIAARGPSDGDTSWSQPITVSLPPGKYLLELFRSHPRIDAESLCAGQELGWYPSASVTLGSASRVAFGLRHDSEPHWSPYSCTDQGYALVGGSQPYSQQLADAVNSRLQDCVRASSPLARVSQQLDVSPPRSPKITLQESLRFGYGNGAREYDARQVRHMVTALKNRCWTWFKSYQRTTDSTTLARLLPIIERSRAEVDRLNAIADRLDRAN